MENTTAKLPLKFTYQIKEYLFLGICLVCMALFLFSAYEKIVEHEKFLNGLSKVKFIKEYAVFISFGVPILEIIISILLLIPTTQVWGLKTFIGLMGIFTIYISAIWIWAEKLPCNCNLIIDKLTWGEHLWFNILFIGIAILALKLQNKPINNNQNFSK